MSDVEEEDNEVYEEDEGGAATAPDDRAWLDPAIGLFGFMAGLTLILIAMRRSPFALNFYAGLDGSVTTVCLGVGLALLHGFSPRQTAFMAATVMVIEAIVLALIKVPLAGPIGVELLVAGGLIALATLAKRPSSSPPEEERDGEAA